MRHDTITLIDEHTVVACSMSEASTHLYDPTSVAAWFGARYGADRTSVDIGETTLQFCHRHVEWDPEQQVVTVDGTVNGLRYHAHLTLRGVIRRRARGGFHEATEIWAHVELAPARSAYPTARSIRAILLRGLHHLKLELDTNPDATR